MSTRIMLLGSKEVSGGMQNTSFVSESSSTDPEIMMNISCAISLSLYKYSSGANCEMTQVSAQVKTVLFVFLK
jgi:putative Mn2+ efflux pump MntP